MLSYAPQSIYLMHFSRVTGVQRLAQDLKEQIELFPQIAQAHARDAEPAAGIRADLLALWLRRARAHGITLTDAQIGKMLEGDLELNTQGLIAWLARTQREEHA